MSGAHPPREIAAAVESLGVAKARMDTITLLALSRQRPRGGTEGTTGVSFRGRSSRAADRISSGTTPAASCRFRM